MKRLSLFGFDPIIIGCSIFLMAAGILFIHSSGVTSTGEVYSLEYVKQIIWASTGLIIMLVFSVFNHNRLRDLALYFYLFCLLLLIVTLIVGIERNGAKSWLGFGEIGIQPSEFMKMAAVLLLARFYASFGGKAREIHTFLLGLAITALPIIVIVLQPDMGTALVYVPIFLVMSYIAGVKVRYILFIVITAFITLFLSVLPQFEHLVLGKEFPVFNEIFDSRILLFFLGALIVIMLFSAWGYFGFKKKYFYWFLYSSLILCTSIIASFASRYLLKDYQIMRLVIFLNPNVDPKGAGWNIIQSITAIGSGGFLGKGFKMGTQSHYNYLPQQSTDFIFSILSEEWGFVGSFFLLLAFLSIFLRGIRILNQAKDDFTVLAGSGILTMIFFHVIVNVGMTIGIMPITGIPLMLVSRGGSSLWTACMGLGIILNMYLRRYRY